MQATRKALASFVLLGTFAGLGLGCHTAPKTETAKENLHDEAVVALNKFKRSDSTMQGLLDRAAGYAIFPDVGKGGFIVGGAYGKGEVFSKGQSIGWADISQGSVGAQIGAQSYTELVVFQTSEALDRFKNNNFTFGANMTAVALRSGAGQAADFKDGVAVFYETNGGLMAEAAFAGQKFTFRPRE